MKKKNVIIKEERIKEYLSPVKIAAASPNVINAEALLGAFEKQNFFKVNSLCEVRGKGYIILDYGREIYGSARIQTNRYYNMKDGNNFRIRFGESLSETCSEPGVKGAGNDHSVRDFSFYMSSNSDMEWGNTGFRFIRIDFLLDQTYTINKIAAGYTHTDAVQKGSFSTSLRGDNVKRIYDTAAYTLFLNMQNLVWDGIKRDQHLWVGDLYPELTGIFFAFGNVKILRESLEGLLAHYKMPVWYNEIPAYNVWFLLCANDFVKYSGEEIPGLSDAVLENLKLFSVCAGKNGELDFDKAHCEYWCDDFFEWPCKDTPYGKTGVYFLLKYALLKLAEEKFFGEEITNNAKALLSRLTLDPPFTGIKSIEALRALTSDDECVKKETARFLKRGGAKGCSIFLIYFILKALAENGEGAAAMSVLREYYGGMLDKGATTFWENFDIEWCKGSCRIDEFPKENEKDIHGDFGAHCYQGFRHSLCHGWSSGAITFLAECVAGVRVTGKGFSKIRFAPVPGIDEPFECRVPTPYGEIFVRRVFTGEEYRTECVVPKGIETRS